MAPTPRPPPPACPKAVAKARLREIISEVVGAVRDRHVASLLEVTRPGGAVVVIFVCRIGPLVLWMDRSGMACILRTVALGLRQVFLLEGNTAVLEELEGFFLL